MRIETRDGALIVARGFGAADADGRVAAALAASEPTAFDGQRIRTHRVLGTGDPRYRWVNQSVLAGEGRPRPRGPGIAGFEHRVYTVDR